MTNQVFLESLYAVLVLAHLGATFFLVGSMVHNFLCVLGYLKGNFARRSVEKRYTGWILASYAVVYLFGALAYPAFKVYINYPAFLVEKPWVYGIFEVKEHWAVIGLLMAGGYHWLRRHFDPKEDRSFLALYVPLCFLFNATVWYLVVSGCWITLQKGSWS